MQLLSKDEDRPAAHNACDDKEGIPFGLCTRQVLQPVLLGEGSHRDTNPVGGDTRAFR
jgi:hypothetical protein